MMARQTPSSRHVADVIPEYLSDALDGAARAAFDAHIAVCADCADGLALWTSVASSLRAETLGIDIEALIDRAIAGAQREIARDLPTAPVPKWRGWSMPGVVRSVAASFATGDRLRYAGLTAASISVTALLLADGGASSRALIRSAISTGYYSDSTGLFGGYYDDETLLYTYTQYEAYSSGGSSSPSSDSGSSTTTTTAPVTAPAAPAVVTVAVPGVPGLKVSLNAAEAKNLQAALGAAPGPALQSFTAALGRLDGATAGAVLKLVASVPADQVAKMIGVVGALPGAQAEAALKTVATLPAAQAAALLGTAATFPADVAAKVFAQVASIGTLGVPVSVAVPGAVTKGPGGVDLVSYNLDDDGATASSLIGDTEVAGVRNASVGRVSLILVKPGQQARLKRPKSGVWPTLATPVTAGAQAGLTPWISAPADATDVWFEPTPATANEVQRGSLGGGSVIPLSAPFGVTVAGNKASKVAFSLPSIPVAPSMEFGYLAQASDASGAFIGYVRADAKFNPSNGRQEIAVSVGDLAGVFMIPAAFQPAYVQNFRSDLKIWSGWDDKAASFGDAGPQFTTFKVIAPQIGKRIFVFNPVTENYGWIDADGVGPSGAPK
jgi:hypothetical protein